jgi:AcrR family transcriptional regulator
MPSLNLKVQKGLETRRDIVERATQLFAELGYAGVSIEAVLAACQISRGALYHHFAGKEALFEAVFEAVEISITERTTAVAGRAQTPAGALRAGCDSFLDLAGEKAVRQITLIDAPTALGWAKWREIDERHAFGLLKAALAQASAGGALPAELVDNFAHMLLASLMEVALLIARADDHAAATALGKASIQTLLDRLLGAAPAAG